MAKHTNEQTFWCTLSANHCRHHKIRIAQGFGLATTQLFARQHFEDNWVTFCNMTMASICCTVVANYACGAHPALVSYSSNDECTGYEGMLDKYPKGSKCCKRACINVYWCIDIDENIHWLYCYTIALGPLIMSALSPLITSALRPPMSKLSKDLEHYPSAFHFCALFQD